MSPSPENLMQDRYDAYEAKQNDPATREHRTPGAKCECGGNVTWCATCMVWSKTCCHDYGTCMCS
jgi:hypothetical protein